jgi:hypothetical protein
VKQGLLARASEHPRQGAAAASAESKQVREDVLRVLIEIVGRDLVLSKIAALGEDRALAAARVLGLSPDRWKVDREQRQRTVKQTTMRTVPSASYDQDAMHSKHVTDAILRGAGMAEISACIAQAQAEIDAAKAARKNVGPGGPDREPTRPPVQRSLVSTNPDAQYRADEDRDADRSPAAPRRVSKPPMPAHDPAGA